MSREDQKKWTIILKRNDWGYQNDRSVFVHHGVAFVAQTWDEERYTWMKVSDGEEIVVDVDDEEWFDHEVFFLVNAK